MRDRNHFIMYTILIPKPLGETQRRHDLIAVMSAVRVVKIGIFPYINLNDVFMCTDSHATKEKQKATSVHSTTKTPGKSQRFFFTAEIDSIFPGITTM